MIRWRQDRQNLEVDFDTGTARIGERERRPLEQMAGSIRKRCHDLPHAALHVRVSRGERDGEFEVEMVLETMKRSLRGIAKADNLPEAVGGATEKIVSQMGPFKAALRRDEIYKARHREDFPPRAELKATPTWREDPQFRRFQKGLENYWRPLVRQVNREVGTLEMNNLLPLGELAAQDIVDEVIVRAFEQFRERPTDVPLEIWLYRLARRALAQRRGQLQRETPVSSMPPARSMKQTLPPPSPPGLLTSEEDVLMDLLEPESELRAGDELADPDEAIDPGAPHQRTQLQQALRRTINRLPEAQREAVWLHYLDGFDAGEIAAVQDRSERDVRNDMDQAVMRLREALRRRWEGQDGKIAE